jgi:peptidoglycan/xylan/chitin deacetylase (PgdA/CDA1 family)
MGTITTSLVIIIGFAMVMPFFSNISKEMPQNVLLFIYIENDDNVTDWCEDLSNILNKRKIVATIFFTGSILEKNPDIIESFGEGFDFGSQTYSNINLSSIKDYSKQLMEIKKGKEILDTVGNLSSGLFRAPYWTTNDDIYSLLTRSSIVADFSYMDHYNKFHNSQFLFFNITSINGLIATRRSIIKSKTSVIIYFNNTIPVNTISYKLSQIKTPKIRFINASELTNLNLTTKSSETF